MLPYRYVRNFGWHEFSLWCAPTIFDVPTMNHYMIHCTYFTNMKYMLSTLKSNTEKVKIEKKKCSSSEKFKL